MLDLLENDLTVLLVVGLFVVLVMIISIMAVTLLIRRRSRLRIIQHAIVSPDALNNPLPDAPPKTVKPLTITSHDISAIAGEDILSTQLDLARAYIDTGRKQLAKKILDYVAQQGSDRQQHEARILLDLI